MNFKKITFLCLLLSVSISSFSTFAYNNDQIKVLTFNIRVSTPDDQGARDYLNRKPLVQDIINGYVDPKLKDLDFIAFQEDNWGNNSPQTTYSQIIPKPSSSNLRMLYNANKWKLISANQTTLNKTPEIPANWGPRYFQYVEFSNIGNGRRLYIFNYHGFVGGPHQADFNEIIKQINLILGNNIPVIFMGDFNPTAAELVPQLKKIPLQGVTGDCTFNGWNPDPKSCAGKLDYIFFSNQLKSIEHSVIKANQGVLASDHYPVYEELQFQ